MFSIDVNKHLNIKTISKTSASDATMRSSIIYSLKYPRNIASYTQRHPVKFYREAWFLEMPYCIVFIVGEANS